MGEEDASADRPTNVSFFEFVGGVQLLQGEDARTVVPVILIALSASGAAGNLLVLLVFLRDFGGGRGSEAKALLASLAATDLAILLLCAPVRALTYYRRTWTLGSFACGAADWFQHCCVVARSLTLAATAGAGHAWLPGGAGAPACGSARTRVALALVWIASTLLPLPQMLYASVVRHGADAVCVSRVPPCAADFMSLFYKIYPAAAFVAPVTFALGYHAKTLHSALNRAPSPRHQSKVTVVLLCLSGAFALLLLPEWASFAWIRLGHSKPPVGLVVVAQVLLYACSSLSPVILMTAYDDVRHGLVAVCRAATCRGGGRPNADGHGAEVGGAVALGGEPGRTFPDVEHFWTGRGNTHVEEGQDPVPWESDDEVLK